MVRSTQQLTLDITTWQGDGFDTFYPGVNLQLCQSLAQLTDSLTSGYYYLWGGAGSGKSHLLKAVCQKFNQAGRSGAYLDGCTLSDFTSENLNGLQRMDVVCMDNVQGVAGNVLCEEGVFHLYNGLRESGGALVVSGNVAPRLLPIELADLKSRLSSGEVYHLQPLNDKEKLDVLVTGARKRGFSLEPDVGEYIIQRSARDMRTLLGVLETLDEHSLSEHRLITVPFVKKVLDW